MLARMTQREFVQWQIRNKTNPIGAWRDDLRIGTVISPIYNEMLKYLYKNPSLTKPSDWVMKFGKAKRAKPQDWRQMKEIFMALAKPQAP